MQVHSRPSSYNQAPRTPGSDRKSAEQESDAAASRSRRDDAITGSQAVLSNSLADALWAIQSSSTGEDSAPAATMAELYRAYAN